MHLYKLVNIYDSLFLLSNTNVSSTSSWLIFARTIGQLFFLIFLFVIVYFYMNKLKNKTMNPVGSNYKNIEIIERKYINNFSSLTLVKVNNKVLLLGMTKDKINVLTEFDESEFDFNKKVEDNKFKDIFNKSFSNFKKFDDRGTEIYGTNEEEQNDVQ